MPAARGAAAAAASAPAGRWRGDAKAPKLAALKRSASARCAPGPRRRGGATARSAAAEPLGVRRSPMASARPTRELRSKTGGPRPSRSAGEKRSASEGDAVSRGACRPRRPTTASTSDLIQAVGATGRRRKKTCGDAAPGCPRRSSSRDGARPLAAPVDTATTGKRSNGEDESRRRSRGCWRRRRRRGGEEAQAVFVKDLEKAAKKLFVEFAGNRSPSIAAPSTRPRSSAKFEEKRGHRRLLPRFEGSVPNDDARGAIRKESTLHSGFGGAAGWTSRSFSVRVDSRAAGTSSTTQHPGASR